MYWLKLIIVKDNYSSKLMHYKDNFLLVAINYNKEIKNKKYNGTIIKYDKHKKI